MFVSTVECMQCYWCVYRRTASRSTDWVEATHDRNGDEG